MSAFKLIAIRPLPKCGDDYLRVLKAGELYPIYQNSIVKINGGLAKIERNDNTQDGLFHQGKVAVHLSAIVGKNGSGKSSLIDLLIAAVYLLSIQKPTGKDRAILKKTPGYIQGKLERLKKKSKRLNNELKACKKILNNEENVQPSEELAKFLKETPLCSEKGIEFFQDLKNSVKETHLEIRALEALHEAITDLIEQLKVEIYFTIGKRDFRLVVDADRFSDGPCRIEELTAGVTNDSDLIGELGNCFFYSILLNYSHYALNAVDNGPWINELFHKNDAYQTPMVINPWRNQGNIDINRENDLVRARLQTMILRVIEDGNAEEYQKALAASPRNLTGNRIARHLILTPKEEKLEHLWRLHNEEEYWAAFADKFGLRGINLNEIYRGEDAKRYILSKLSSMTDKYDRYRAYGELYGFKKFGQYLDKLKKDHSHMTYKIRQTVNYLRHGYDRIIEQAKDGIDPNRLAKAIAKAMKSDFAYDHFLIEYIPPAFFELDLDFDEKPAGNNTFKKLSSGEKQQIYALSSLSYHLSYIDSAKAQEGEEDFIEYQYINIVFDEIEMYYHPELQRTFVNDFLDTISRANLQRIKGVNAIFVTHSPFILSDIPSRNTLRLNLDGEYKRSIPVKDDIKTFGANIHELLTNGFFMKSTMGEFVEQKVREIVNFHHRVMRETEEEKAAVKEEFEEKKDGFKFVVENIGEKVVQRILFNHLELIEAQLSE